MLCSVLSSSPWGRPPDRLRPRPETQTLQIRVSFIGLLDLKLWALTQAVELVDLDDVSPGPAMSFDALSHPWVLPTTANPPFAVRKGAVQDCC